MCDAIALQVRFSGRQSFAGTRSTRCISASDGSTLSRLTLCSGCMVALNVRVVGDMVRLSESRFVIASRSAVGR